MFRLILYQYLEQQNLTLVFNGARRVICGQFLSERERFFHVIVTVKIKAYYGKTVKDN